MKKALVFFFFSVLAAASCGTEKCADQLTPSKKHAQLIHFYVTTALAVESLGILSCMCKCTFQVQYYVCCSTVLIEMERTIITDTFQEL